MFDDENERRMWPLSLVRWGIAGGIVAVAVWLGLNRERYWPKPVSIEQHLAVVRDSMAPESARRRAADSLRDADASVVGELVRELKEGDSLGRELAALALGRLGAKAADAVPPLIAAAATADSRVEPRRQAIIALGRIAVDHQATVAALRAGVHDANLAVRREAFTALRCQRAAGAHELIGLLRDADADVRRRAAIELGRCGADDPAIASRLRFGLADADPKVRAEVYAALFHRSAIDSGELIAAMKNDVDPLVRRTTVMLLARMPRVGAETLAPALVDAEPAVRCAGLKELGDWGSDARPMVERIAELLDSADAMTARDAAIALAKIGPAARNAVESLLAHTDDERGSVRQWVFGALREIGPEAELRPPELFAALHIEGDKARSVILWTETYRTVQNAAQPPSLLFRNHADRGYGITDADMAHFKRLQQLELLDLSYNPVGDAGLAQIAGLKRLKWLSLDRTKITSAGLIHLTKLSALRWLSLNECAIQDDGLQLLKDLPELEYLGLAGTRITNAAMPALATLPKLKALSIGGTKVSDIGLTSLRDLSSLEKLTFYPGQFSLRGLGQLRRLTSLEHVARSVKDDDLQSLEGMTHLRKLALLGTSITDLGLRTVARLSSLEVLLLDGANITDAGLIHLKPLTKLRLLSLAYTLASEEGAAALQQSLPELEIRFVPLSPLPPAVGYEVEGLKSSPLAR